VRDDWDTELLDLEKSPLTQGIEMTSPQAKGAIQQGE
jgi:hypothetical protein